MQTPQFNTAIPKHRYQIGNCTAVVLGDIESKDDNEYVYAFALVKEGAAEPHFFVTLEKNNSGPQAYTIRVISEALDQPIGVSDQLLTLDEFCHGALTTCAQLENLSDEEPIQLS